MVSKPFESSEGSAMDEEALVALGFQFLKKENDQLSKMDSGMAELTLESKSLLNDVRELKAMVYHNFNIPIPTHKVAKEVSIMASELSDQHKGTRCEQLVVIENSFCSAHQVFDETPKSANIIEVVQIDESSEDGGEALFEIVGWIKRDEERPTNSDDKYKSESAQPTNDNDELTGKMLKADDDLNQDLAAHQVFDEMSRSLCSREINSSDHMTKLVDEFNFESTPVSSVGELDDSRAFKVSDLKDTTSLLLFKNEFTDFLSLLNEMPTQEEIRMNYREVLCFDPGGGFLDLVGDSFKFEIVPLESSNLGCDEELTKRNTEKVEFVPKVGDYGDCLPSFYPTNGQIFEATSVCAEMLNFDPGERELRNLAEPFLHRFHFARSSLLKFVVLKEISCLVLCSLDDTQLLLGTNNESLIFDPGREEFMFGYINLICLSNGCGSVLVIPHISLVLIINEARNQLRYKWTDRLSAPNIYTQQDALPEAIKVGMPHAVGTQLMSQECNFAKIAYILVYVWLALGFSGMIGQISAVSLPLEIEVMGLCSKMSLDRLALIYGNKFIISSEHELEVNFCIIEYLFCVGESTAETLGHHEGRIVILVFDPGGQLDLTRCWHNTQGVLASAVYSCLILEDKDHLKEGVLLQENGLAVDLWYFNDFCY